MSLQKELEIVKMARGDYSKDRYAWVDGWDVDTIVNRIREKPATYKKSK